MNNLREFNTVTKKKKIRPAHYGIVLGTDTHVIGRSEEFRWITFVGQELLFCADVAIFIARPSRTKVFWMCDISPFYLLAKCCSRALPFGVKREQVVGEFCFFFLGLLFFLLVNAKRTRHRPAGH